MISIEIGLQKKCRQRQFLVFRSDLNYVFSMSAKNLLEKYKTEINVHDFDTLEPLLSKDCTFWFSSGTYKGLDETRQAFEKTWALIQEEVYTITEVNWLYDNESSAACIYTYYWAGLINGQHREGKGRGTSLFRLESGAWKIVHEHLSAFPNA